MVVGCRGQQLFKSGKTVTFSKKFPFGPSNNTFGYKNYSSLCLNSVPSKGEPLVRLWCDCRKLHFTRETTRSVLTKLTPQETVLFKTCTARLLSRGTPEESESGEGASQLRREERGIGSILTQLKSKMLEVLASFKGVFLSFGSIGNPVLQYVREVWVENLIQLFNHLRRMRYSRIQPIIYIPLLIMAALLEIINGTLFVIINIFSNNPEGSFEVVQRFVTRTFGFVISLLTK